jgi:hypothetical protein
MAQHRQIRWTTAQREILTFLRQGLRVNDVVAKGYGRSNIERVNREFKKGTVPPPIPGVENTVAEPGSDSEGTKNTSPTGSDGETSNKVKIRTLNPVSVGGIFIEPADWRINQYGGFMIMNTHALARERFGYTGTVGEFLCDACQVLRTLMGGTPMPFDYLIKEGEDNDNGSEESGEGTDVHEEIGAGAGGSREAS